MFLGVVSPLKTYPVSPLFLGVILGTQENMRFSFVVERKTSYFPYQKYVSSLRVCQTSQRQQNITTLCDSTYVKLSTTQFTTKLVNVFIQVRPTPRIGAEAKRIID